MARTSLRWALPLILLAATACTSPPPIEPRPAPTPAPLVQGHCPRDGAGLIKPLEPDDPYRGSLPPAGFRPVTVIRCTGNLGHSENGYEIFPVTEYSAVVTPDLLAALDLPDEVPKRADFGCPENLEPTLYLLLVDTTGRGYRPRVPITPCSRPLPEVKRVVEAMPWQAGAKFTIKHRS